MQKPNTDAELLSALAAELHFKGNVRLAAIALNMSRSTLYSRIDRAHARVADGTLAPVTAPDLTPAAWAATAKRLDDATPAEIPEDFDEQEDDGSAEYKIRMLETQLAAYKRNDLSAKMIRSQIMKLAEHTPAPPSWLLSTDKSGQTTGVPTLMLSDLHWAEVIDPDQIGGVNSYDLATAHKRLHTVIESTIALLFTHLSNPEYPGVVLALGGDMVSGDIHDELVESNEIPLIPAMLDLLGALTWAISHLADHFGAVFVPCVTGNHGRNTQKIRAKGRHHTSFDWLLYTLLEKAFIDDPRVTFMIPDGPDAYYRVYNHKYLLTHGDQFRGGDGVIGALGPIIRGDHKKRSRNAQIDMSYDTMMIGHWHQLIQMQRLIVNGSLCGYNEYAYAGNFGFEVPRQALWITHPERGITFSMPVHAEAGMHSGADAAESSWVSVKSK
jgi:hypothetical protein